MNNKIRKLICILVLTTFVGESIAATNSAYTDNTAIKASTSLSTDPGLSDKSGVWANIVSMDWETRNSRTDLVINNYGKDRLELVGCDNPITPGFEGNIIQDNSSFPKTKMFDPKWSAFADDHGQIYDPAHIQKYSLQFNINRLLDKNEHLVKNCYYRIYHPEANDSLYVKLKTDTYRVATHGVTTEGQPDIDSKDVDNTDTGKAISDGRLKLADLTREDLAWDSQRDKSYSLAEYLNTLLQDRLNTNVEILNQKILASKLPQAQSSTKRLQDNIRISIFSDADSEKLLTMLRIGVTDQNRMNLTDTVRNNLVKDFFVQTTQTEHGLDGDLFVTDHNGARYNMTSPQDRTKFCTEFSLACSPDDIADAARLDAVGVPVPGGHGTPLFEGYGNKVSVHNELVATGNPVLDAEVRANVVGERASIAEAGDSELVAMGARRVERRAVSTTTAVGVTTAVVILVTVALILWQKVFKPKTQHDNPKGNADTGVVHMSLEAPSASDAAAWNSVHPDNPIEANTKATQILAKANDPSSNNSLSHAMQFTFNTPDADTQIGNLISLDSMSSPWLRGSLGQTDDDPLLGAVSSKTDRFTDAVVGMTVMDTNLMSAVKDAGYSYYLSNLANLGISELAQDNRLPAPTYSVQQISNTANPQTLYSTGMNSTLFNGRNGLAKIKGIEGLVLNDGQQVTMNVRLGSNGSDISNGGGLGARLVSQEESGARNYISIKSSKFADSLAKLGDGTPYFYNKFNCTFPPRAGDDCQLTMGIGGTTLNKKYMQRVYLGDAVSKTTSIPVYLNYHLVSEPQSADITNGDSSPVQIMIKNFGAEAYKKIEVSNLPAQAKLVANQDGAPACTKGLPSGSTCELSYDMSKVDSGTYSLLVYGVTSSGRVPVNSDDSDAGDFTLSVDGGF